MEPKRNASIDSLEPYVADRVRALLAAMAHKGFDAVVFEARRSEARQRWLYAIGRTRQKNRRPVTWTLESRHIHGKAADIISKSRGWGWPEFYDVLAIEAKRVGLYTIPQERCHVQFGKL